jgi:hypothetical protein
MIGWYGIVRLLNLARALLASYQQALVAKGSITTQRAEPITHTINEKSTFLLESYAVGLRIQSQSLRADRSFKSPLECSLDVHTVVYRSKITNQPTKLNQRQEYWY